MLSCRSVRRIAMCWGWRHTGAAAALLLAACGGLTESNGRRPGGGVSTCGTDGCGGAGAGTSVDGGSGASGSPEPGQAGHDAGGASGAGGSHDGPGAGGTESAGAGGTGGEAGSGGAGGDTSAPILETSCGTVDLAEATVFSGTLTTDTIWSGIVHVPESLVIENSAHLTIEPGTIVVAGPGVTIELGPPESPATLTALGTAESPICFSGEQQATGSWAGIVFGVAVTDSMLRHAAIKDAGDGSPALALEGSLTLQDVQVLNSASDGVHAARFGAESSALIVSGAAGYPLIATSIRGVEAPADSTLVGNGKDALLLDFAFAFGNEGVTFKNLGVPFRQLTGLLSYGPSTLVFEAGVTLEMGPLTSFTVVGADVYVLGTEDEPVVFTAIPCAALPEDPSCQNGADLAEGGSFLPTYLYSYSSELTIEHAVFRHLGWGSNEGGVPALYVDTGKAVTFKDVRVEQARGIGIDLANGSFTQDSAGLFVEVVADDDHVPTALHVRDCNYVVTLPADTVLNPGSGNALRLGWCTEITSSGVVRNLGWPYTFVPPDDVPNDFRIRDGASVSVEPGVRMEMAADAGVVVESGATLQALGTSEAPIEFTGSGWPGILAEAGSTVVLDNVVITGGGANGGANLTAQAPVTLTSSTLADSQGWGVLKSAGDATDYASSNTFTNNALGDIGTF